MLCRIDPFHDEAPTSYLQRQIQEEHSVDGHCLPIALITALGLDITVFELRVMINTYIEDNKAKMREILDLLTDEEFERMRRRLLPRRASEAEWEAFERGCAEDFWLGDEHIAVAACMLERVVMLSCRGLHASWSYLPDALEKGDYKPAIGLIYNGVNHWDWATLKDAEAVPPVRTQLWHSNAYSSAGAQLTMPSGAPVPSTPFPAAYLLVAAAVMASSRQWVDSCCLFARQR